MEFQFADTFMLDLMLRGAAPGSAEAMLRAALAFLDHVETNPYPGGMLVLPAIPSIADGEAAPKVGPQRPPGSPEVRAQLDAPPNLEGRICRQMGERLLAVLESDSNAGESDPRVLIAEAIVFSTRIASVISWYNGVFADYSEGREASQELDARKARASAAGSSNRAGKTILTESELPKVIRALDREIASGLSQLSACKKISAQLKTGRFRGINREVPVEFETLRGYLKQARRR